MHPDKDVDKPTKSSRGFLLFLAILAAFVALVYFMRPASQPVGMSHHAVGQKLRLVELQPLINAETPVTLADLQGQAALINFWGPWCPPCLMELPEMLDLERRYRDRDDVRILLVSASGGPGTPLDELLADTKATLRKHNASPTIYQDEDLDTIKTVARDAQLDGFPFPTTLLIDGEGTIRAVWTGYHPHFVKEMDDAIEQVVAAANP